MSIIDEPRASMSQCARRLKIHVATLHRWRLTGVGGHQLKTVRIGGRRYVLDKDLEAFFAALNGRSVEPEESFARRAVAAGKALDSLNGRK